MQKRLFDDTKEAEKILHFFESQTIGSIVKLTMVGLVHSAIDAIQVRDLFKKTLLCNYLFCTQLQEQHIPLTITKFDELHEKLVASCCRLSREPWTESASNPRG